MIRRYTFADRIWSSDGVAKPDTSGPWVKFTDVEAEIEKARRQAHIEDTEQWTKICANAEMNARADERERIAREVTVGWTYRSVLGTPSKESILKVILQIILQKGPHAPAQEPKPLEHLKGPLGENPEGPDALTEIMDTVNALVDAVNDLRKVGIYAAGGTRIGEYIYLPNGGTWRRIQ